MTARQDAANGRLTTRAALASTTLALFLLILKGWAAAATGSVAMLGSLADSVFDLVASLITLYGVRLAALPADHDHRFGHGKAEALVALAQVAFIAASAVGIGASAVARLSSDGVAEQPGLGIAVSLVGIAATSLLIGFQRRVIAQTGSVAITADSVHYQSDLLVNAAVIAALALETGAGVRGADAVTGMLIALWLARGAWRAAVRAIDQLMDKEWPDAKRSAFVEIASSHPAFRGIHDLRTRTSGSLHFAQFHVWVDPTMTVAEAHDVMDIVEARLDAAFPGTEVLIHLDPEGRNDRAGRHDEQLRETPEP